MATTHNLNNIVVDRVLRGIFSDKEDNIIFSLNQVQNLSINSTSESQEVLDALGVSIMELMRSKAIEVSAENAIYDFGLLSAQYGTEKTTASSTAKITVPTMETFEVPATGNTVNLAHLPTDIADIKKIYALNGDSTLGEAYEVATTATEGKFSISESEGKAVVTIPAGVTAGTELFVMYEYESENAIELINKANEFAKMGKMTFECLVYDVCDPETKIFAYLILPRFQLSNDFDWSIGGDSQTHAFGGKAHVDYCSKDKQMLRVVVVDD